MGLSIGGVYQNVANKNIIFVMSAGVFKASGPDEIPVYLILKLYKTELSVIQFIVKDDITYPYIPYDGEQILDKIETFRYSEFQPFSRLMIKDGVLKLTSTRIQIASMLFNEKNEIISYDDSDGNWWAKEVDGIGDLMYNICPLPDPNIRIPELDITFKNGLPKQTLRFTDERLQIFHPDIQ